MLAPDSTRSEDHIEETNTGARQPAEPQPDLNLTSILINVVFLIQGPVSPGSHVALRCQDSLVSFNL